jgi:hypothetical protein
MRLKIEEKYAKELDDFKAKAQTDAEKSNFKFNFRYFRN